MILFLLFALCCAMSVVDQIYHVENYCPDESNIFENHCEIPSISFSTVCSRMATFIDKSGCKKGVVIEPGLCKITCQPCDSKSDFCFSLFYQESQLRAYLGCFELEELLHRFLCAMAILWNE